MIVGITGHRIIGDARAYSYVSAELDKLLVGLKPDSLISGMALGSDVLACEICIHRGISFIAALPFSGQEKYWSKDATTHYHLLLQKAAKIEIVCEGDFANWKYQKRNEWIVDNSDMMIGVFDGSKSGTKNCLDYAEKVGKKIVVIDPKLASQ